MQCLPSRLFICLLGSRKWLRLADIPVTTWGTDMADAAIDCLILCFDVKAGIEAHLIKEELGEWNKYGKRILYRMDIEPAGENRGAGQRGVR